MAEPIGSIPVVISGDYSQLQKDLMAAEGIAMMWGKKIGDALGSAGAGARVYSTDAEALIATQKKLDIELANAQGTLAEIKNAYEAGAVGANVLARAESELKTAADAANIALKQESETARAAAAATKEHAAELQKMFSNMQQAGLALTAAVTVPIVALGLASLKMSEQLHQAEVAFTTLLGSAQKAGDFIKELKAFALATPFEFSGLVETAKHMLALGFAAEQVVPMLRTIGDAVAVLGGGQEKIDRITKAFGDLQAKGKVSAQEMKQFAEAGINAWQMLADSIGTSVPEAMKLAEKGVLDASVAIPAILKGMNDKFKGQMEQMSKTLTGVWTQFQEQSQFILADIGKSLAPVMQNLITEVGKPLLSGIKSLTEAFAELDPVTQGAALGFAGIAAAAGPVLASLGLIAQGFTAVSAAVSAMGLSMAAIPWVAAIAGAAALAAGIWRLHEAEKARDEAQNDEAKSITKLETHLKSLGIALSYQEKLYHDGQMSAEMYGKYLNQLAKAHGDTVRPVQAAGAAIKTTTTHIKTAGAEAKIAKDALAGFGEDLRSQLTAAVPSAKELADATREIGHQALEAALAIGHERDVINALNEIADRTRVTLKDMIPSELPKTLEGVTTETQLLADAIANLGKDYSGNLKKTQDQAMQYYLILQQSMDGVKVTQKDVDAQWQKVLETQGIVIEKNHEYDTSVKQLTETQKEFVSITENAFDDLARGLADVITGAKSLGDVFKQVATQIANDILTTIIKGALKPLEEAIVGAIKNFAGMGKAATDAGAAAAKAGVSGAGSAAGGAPGAGVGGLGGLASGVTAISSAVSAVSDVIANFQFYAINKSLDIIVKHTLGTVNQLVSLQGTFNTYLPQIADRTMGIWEELINVTSILRLMGQVSGGGSAGLGQQIADAINSNPHQTDEGVVSDGFSELAENLHASVAAADEYNQALQTTASSAYELDEAVTKTTGSLYNLSQVTRQVNGALPGAKDSMTSSEFDALQNSMVNQNGFGGTGTFSRFNPDQNQIINRVPIPDAITGPGGVMQGAMLPHQNTQLSYPSVAPSVGGPGVSRSAANVFVTAVDPTSRSVTKGIVTGLEEVGIRVR